MKVFFLRLAFVLLLVFLQISFFNILFPWFHAPMFLLTIVVAWTLVLGFPRSLFMILPLTLLFDIISYGKVSEFSLYAVLLAYGTSFLFKRLHLEHRGLGLSVYALYAGSGILVYQLGVSVFFQEGIFHQTASSPSIFLFPSLSILIFSFVMSIPTFLFMHMVLRKFEARMELINQKQFLNVR